MLFIFKRKQTFATYFLYFRELSTLVNSFHNVLDLFLFYSVCVYGELMTRLPVGRGEGGRHTSQHTISAN